MKHARCSNTSTLISLFIYSRLKVHIRYSLLFPLMITGLCPLLSYEGVCSKKEVGKQEQIAGVMGNLQIKRGNKNQRENNKINCKL